ncbi:hypothetical protein BDN72DRAFT_838238 [Pluteus cervinus]|uniref:Uncharacterized protein n=1 Tax=Pluteus cervinus TaxID=181527 RepID=A0ACD3B0A8_9AGAR|nr:hypothetical protein BDN72DRAFT_838238 [Pluteus cervinus]
MHSISISFGSHAAYKEHILSLTGAPHQLQVDFEKGEHVFTSPDLELGTIHAMKDTPLIGRIIFRYTYGAEAGHDSITVCDADYESADGMALMTFPKGREDLSCFERASSAGFAADEIHRNGYWNTRSPLIPGASQIFKDIARDASRAVIAALEAQNVLLNVRTPLPELPLEVYRKFCFVYQDGKFLCTYDDLHQQPRDYDSGSLTIFDLGSTVDASLTHFPPHTNFANVLGSTGDPKPSGFANWTQVWNYFSRRPPQLECSSFNFQVDPPHQPRPFGCNTVMHGGHVILGNAADQVATGSNIVRIIPICGNHNHVSFTHAMNPVKQGWAVNLQHYKQYS